MGTPPEVPPHVSMWTKLKIFIGDLLDRLFLDDAEEEKAFADQEAYWPPKR